MAVKASASITVSIERDISSVTRFYKLASSSSTPTVPTGTADPSGWSKSEPAYDGTSTNSLYLTDRTVFSDGTASWSAVSKSSSYEAAKQAYNKAQNAQESADMASESAEQAQTTADLANSKASELDSTLKSDYLTADSVLDAIDAASQQKVDRIHANGAMEWSENALHISNAYNNAYYETEIGGEGIDFKYGANAETANTVASITKDQLIIHKTIVLKEMLVGESDTQRGLWAWNVRDNQHLQLKWKGGN